jgi:hypothetical protein
MNSKHKNPTQLIQELQALLNELAGSLGQDTSIITKNTVSSSKAETFSGPSGGIKLLLAEGFFAEPKTLPAVVSRLRQDGFNYATQVISTALVRLVRARAMVRIPVNGEGKERWAYAIRK